MERLYMRKACFSSLVFAVLTSISLAVSAAPSAKPEAPTPIAAQMIKAEKTIAKVNLNTADAETLRRDLFGIGAAKAKAIVAYRETSGPFTAVDELLEVKGIGKSLLEKNRDRLEIK
ncbi:helix-hairpin-helix domain-containing protein [Pseudomonas sp. MF5691]|nr:helix-hairpin-helix domain-containing protein [Pseudomonas sp. MF5691]MBJ2289904.1 helix-hairpin-helix domain-containing protein [Pseudomonas sp. MF5691]